MKYKLLILACLILLAFGLGINYVQAQGPVSPTAFTYQGQLVLNGLAVNDTCDFSFTLWEGQPGAGQTAGQQMLATPVNNGLFTV